MTEVKSAEPSSSSTSQHSATRKKRGYKRSNKSKENSVSQKKKRHSKKKSEEKLKEVSQNIQKKPGSTLPSQGDINGKTLLDELQKKVRTGKVPVNEVMGPGYGQASGATKSQSGASIGRTILQRLIGNNVDPEAVFSAALRQVPQVPGFPSIRPHSTVFRPELFKTTMEAYASAAAHCGSDMFSGFLVPLRDAAP
ncbi:unnamed protein product [Heligmosomoides polygyrus]|uniref:Regulator of nonsense transcripts 2 n=1 Tax=Heligmosomoides polygyrus TaxID=6339 RepID=A0A183FFD5_HELPZ|nr:unnamed protein product [Heligmosomoides polygyrus]